MKPLLSLALIGGMWFAFQTRRTELDNLRQQASLPAQNQAIAAATKTGSSAAAPANAAVSYSYGREQMPRYNASDLMETRHPVTTGARYYYAPASTYSTSSAASSVSGPSCVRSGATTVRSIGGYSTYHLRGTHDYVVRSDASRLGTVITKPAY